MDLPSRLPALHKLGVRDGFIIRKERDTPLLPVPDRPGDRQRRAAHQKHPLLLLLPPVSSGVGPGTAPLQSGREESSFMCPGSVYLSSEEIRALLGTHVWYVDLQPSDFTRKLGMLNTVTVESLIQFLKKWCVGDQAEGEELEGSEFTTTVEHIHNVYSYLHGNCSQSVLKELFQHTPAVFVVPLRPTDEEWCSGRFFHLKDVCWSDPTSMFLRYRRPRVLAPFYSRLDGMKDFFTRLLNVDLSPNIKQYVGLLEVVCSSCPSPTSDVLQDVSVLYATLAQKCKIPTTLDQDEGSQPKLNPGYCSTLKGMVSELRVFPAKDNSWVNLSRRPMISDSRELEKIFRTHKEVCLLNLPPAEKTAAKKTKSSRTGPSGERPAFREEDRALFLDICGIKHLSQCVTSEAQTENLRPCPSMQEMVRSVVPYIQRFLYHRDDMADLYSELQESNIAHRIKKLSFGQVGKLYRRYQLDFPDSDSIYEVEDVICLLNNNKELYIQKDHLGAKLDICRELVKLFCSEAAQRKELMHFLSGLITSLPEPVTLKRYLQKEDIRELPEDEEQWEVPEPPKPPQPEPSLDRAISRCSVSDEPPRPSQENGEQTLVCWPPRASIINTGAARKAGEGGVVEAVNRMWPPPAPPKDRPYEGPTTEPKDQASALHPAPENQPRPPNPHLQRTHSHTEPAPPAAAASTNTSSSSSSSPAAPPAEPRDRAQPARESREEGPGAPRRPSAAEHTAAPPAPSAQADDDSSSVSTASSTASDKPAPGPDCVLVSSVFQGSAAAADPLRPPLHMDFPQWRGDMCMEDLVIACEKPSTVFLSDQTDLAAIGEWGERLVHSFLLHWRDGPDPSRPASVLWCNERAESGQPYDFQLSFSGPDTAPLYIEVKSTVKTDKAFIHMSANELDFALKKKEHYHVFRVYSAGDAQSVRLCRIQNLAQHLHTKTCSCISLLQTVSVTGHCSWAMNSAARLSPRLNSKHLQDQDKSEPQDQETSVQHISG
ncbi:hypothetical protein WMY93_009901 [Mugilogobius chulae]|uniref:Protein NO VEIN C-terminal domain-containing protein n=1 Tax=Mugilogobius chulae TaxID=88201 RepID=A0AAW0PEX7_9GOBI